MTDNTANRDTLMDKADRLDTLNTPDLREWIGLTREADRLRRELSGVPAQGRFTAAIAQHGSPQDALRAVKFEVDALTERLKEASETKLRIENERRELDDILRQVTSQLITKGRTLRERQKALQGDKGVIARTRAARSEAIASLVDAGLPLRIADRQAKPTLIDIEGLEQELADLPSEIERNSTLLTSYAGRVELYLAQAAHDEEVA
jgi:chromosome segregation ATPase